MADDGILPIEFVGGFSSRHPLGDNFLFCDGSVRFLKQRDLTARLSAYWATVPTASRSATGRFETSREDRLVDDSLDVGQPHVAAGVAIGQALVVEPEQVEDRRVQIVHVHRVLDGLVAELVGLAVGDPWLDAPAGQPEGEPLVVVVAAVGVLAVRRAAELAAPDHQRLVEQPPRAQVRQQAGDRPIDGPGVPGVAGLQAAVLVPVAVRQLDEADAGLDEAPRQQALAAEVGGRRVVEAVQRLRRRRLTPRGP